MPNISASKKALVGRPCLTCQRRKIKVCGPADFDQYITYLQRLTFGTADSVTEPNRIVNDVKRLGCNVAVIHPIHLSL